MARNAEKAMTALARFRQAQLEEGKVKERRPFLASECSELPKAEKWRRQIISEISKKVAQIQNAGLGEFKIRDLNDEINKLLREKGHWEVRIKELRGPDYRRIGPRMLDHEGKEVPGNRGYKYFGAARDLPGVRELFEKEPTPAQRRTRAELMKDVDAEYYGYRDEDDGVLLPLEALHEKQAIQEAVQKWKTEKESRLSGEKQQEEEEESIYSVHNEESHVCFVCLCSLMRRTMRSRRQRRAESPSSHMFLFRLRKRWRKLWSGGRRWSCCSVTPVRHFKLRVKKPELCWDSDPFCL
ncbi:pre-mRNA-splicing factor ISY1 homolog isoform X1 [Nematolebias whitei]|uniref:pre-mRNA-splicing factor ISY1 homolog isoform X1 n=1 Tax=Nematolebias whitei TaxID=451745 RepID=UPI00189AE747|nr:pre-mRNA-splicing factor ISY1 homolog isoform X1 [Nematolebias whitei]